MVLDDESPWDGILASIMFTLRATVHTTMQYTPAPLVFGRDSILTTCHEANWHLIKKHKQDLINKGKQYKYNKGGKVLLKNVWKTKFNHDAYLGPYMITTARNDGTVRASKGIITDTFNTRNISPYME